MVPFVDLRNYAKFIISYPMTLLKIYNGKKVTVSSEDFIRLFDFILSKKKGIAKDLEVSLTQQSPVLRVNFILIRGFACCYLSPIRSTPL